MENTSSKPSASNESRSTSGSRDELFRLLWEQSDDVIWFTRPDGSFVDVNRGAVETYGYSRDEFLGMNVRDLRHDSALAEFGKQLRSA